eukprot:2902700-Amphidinium_carterae.4
MQAMNTALYAKHCVKECYQVPDARGDSKVARTSGVLPDKYIRPTMQVATHKPFSHCNLT